MSDTKRIPDEQKIVGTELASTMTINHQALLTFMAAASGKSRMTARKAAQEAQRYLEYYLAACNEEIFSPGEE